MTSLPVAKRTIPLWAMAVIGLVVCGMLVVLTAVIGAFYTIDRVQSESQSPREMAKVIKEFISEQEVLPSGYRYTMAFSFWGAGAFAVEHIKDKQTLTLIFYPSTQEGDSDPKKVLAAVTEGGLSAPARIKDVKQRGEVVVGGYPMAYVQGLMSGNSGKEAQGFIGCLYNSAKKKTITVFGIQALGSDYNLGATLNYLKTIKSF